MANSFMMVPVLVVVVMTCAALATPESELGNAPSLSKLF
jgi:hypothetical protein